MGEMSGHKQIKKYFVHAYGVGIYIFHTDLNYIDDNR